MTVTISTSSRYKDTPVYVQGGEPEFALWEPPPEFSGIKKGYRTHLVKSHEVGFLDIIAVTYYGPGSEHLWWVIAQTNALIDIDRDMFPGQILYIPSQAAVLKFKARRGDAVQ
jgi:hypothetical protein